MGSPSEYSDVELLASLAKEEHAAFRILFDRYNSKVFSIAFKFLKSKTLAEDVVQDVFAKIWVKRNELNKLNDFKAYLNTITKNHLLNHLQKLANTEKYIAQERRRISYSNTVATVIELNDLNYSLAKAVNKLTPQQKKVYHLGKVHGLSYEQIAEQLEVSKETVKSHMAEALRSIRSYLQDIDSNIVNYFIAYILITKFIF